MCIDRGGHPTLRSFSLDLQCTIIRNQRVLLVFLDRVHAGRVAFGKKVCHLLILGVWPVR